MWTRTRAVAVGIATLTLAACGSIHPGDAAVVDDHSISMAKLDKTARIYCELTLISAAEQGAVSVPNSDVRRQAIADLVTIYVARDLAEEEGITVDKQVYELTSDQVKEVEAAFPDDDDAETVAFAIENSQEIAAIAVALGEKSTGVTSTSENATDLASEGQAAITAAFKDHDVKFAPRFGLNGTLEEVRPTGSLSVTDIDFDSPSEEELPADQRCA